MDSCAFYGLLAFVTFFFITAPYIIWKLAAATASDGTVVKGGAMFLTLFAAMLLFLAGVFLFSITLQEIHLLIGFLLFIILFILIESEKVRRWLVRATGLGGK